MITWEQLRGHFERDGIRYVERDGDVKVLEVALQLSESVLELEVAYDAQNGVVRFVVPDVNIPRRLPRNRHELRRALMLLNSCLILGSFSETVQGNIAFTITTLIEGNDLTYPAYRRMLNAVAASVGRAVPWLRRVAMGALSAEEAIENILEDARKGDERDLESGQPREASAITEDEIEEFGRALMDGKIPPPC